MSHTTPNFIKPTPSKLFSKTPSKTDSNIHSKPANETLQFDFRELNRRFQQKHQTDDLMKTLTNTKIENQQLENAILSRAQEIEEKTQKMIHFELQTALLDCLDSMPSCLDEIPGGYTKILEPIEKLVKIAFLDDSVVLGVKRGDLKREVDKMLGFIDENYIQLKRGKKVGEIDDLENRYQVLRNKNAWLTVLEKNKVTGKKFGAEIVL